MTAALFVDSLKGAGKVHLYAIVGTPLVPCAFGFLHVSGPLPEAAVSVLDNAVQSSGSDLNLSVEAISTDNDRQFCSIGRRPCEFRLEFDGIEHHYTKTCLPKANDTVLDELFRSKMGDNFHEAVRHCKLISILGMSITHRARASRLPDMRRQPAEMSCHSQVRKVKGTGK